MVILWATPMAFEGSKKKPVIFNADTRRADWWCRAWDRSIDCVLSVSGSSQPLHRKPRISAFPVIGPCQRNWGWLFCACSKRSWYEHNCIRPAHTLEENVIHVAYSRPHDFTLGHFPYYWLGNDLCWNMTQKCILTWSSMQTATLLTLY
jgi:hypothetical protein